jgi:hypothetical protein
MSNQGKKIVKCPNCGYEFEAIFWTVVRGDIDLELKEMIINGEFDLLLCPECKKLFSYEDTFVYMDPSSEIMAFVMPQETENREEMLEKMKADYNLLKGNIESENILNFKPYYFFGIDYLTELLLNDRDIEEETEVIRFIAADFKFEMVDIGRSYARQYGLPFSLPYTGELNIESVFNCSKKIFEYNDRLSRLKRLIELLEKNADEKLPFIKKR